MITTLESEGPSVTLPSIFPKSMRMATWPGARFSPRKREWPQNDREYNKPAVGLEIGKFLPENGQGHRDKNADEYK